MGYQVGRKRIRRLMRRMGLRAIAPGPESFDSGVSRARSLPTIAR